VGAGDLAAGRFHQQQLVTRLATWQSFKALTAWAPANSWVNLMGMPAHFTPTFPEFLLGPVLAVLVATAGCSDTGVKKVTVSGTISHKGQPLRSGILQFVGPESYSAASIQPDGTYIITDVIPGEVKVGVLESPQGSGSSSGEQTSVAAQPAPVVLPAKYRSPDTSDVKYTITESTSQLNIELP
jgi:hypothetical protein